MVRTTTPDLEHPRRVRAVASAVKALATSTERAHISKGGIHHVVPLPGDRRFRSAPIDTSALTNIISIDTRERICVAEPGVTFEQLVRATLPLGLAPAVVPELRGITLGGAVAGCSVESMSFRYGGFHDSAVAYEVVGGDGEVRQLSATNDPHLFEHIHGSYGTLGILTELTFRLVPAKPFVKMTYRHFPTLAEFREALNEVCALNADGTPAGGFDFVDGIVHGPRHLTLCCGNFVEEPPNARPSTYSTDRIYYRSTAGLTTDLMSAEEYFFRYDRECHWLTATVPPLQWPAVRKRLGNRLLGSTNLITWSNRLGPVLGRIKRRPDLVCDIFVPETAFDEFWEWYCRVFDFWPLWVVPYRPASVYPWLGPRVREAIKPGELFIDFAVYGKPNSERARDYSVLLEDKTFELGGIKTLIGRNHYTEDRFWQVYDREAYERAKAELDPNGMFPTVFEKLGNVD